MTAVETQLDTSPAHRDLTWLRESLQTAIALELYDRAVAHGVHFAWLTFDEWYGTKPAFLQALDARGQTFVGEVHKAWGTPMLGKRPGGRPRAPR